MIDYLINLIVKKELNKIDASSEAMFYNILCNKYNKGNEFDWYNHKRIRSTASNDVCICIVKETQTIHSIGVNEYGEYYSDEGGGYFDLNKNKDIFQYVEMSWRELRKLIIPPLPKP